MNIQQEIGQARVALKQKNTFISANKLYGVRYLLDVPQWRKRKKRFRSYDIFAEDGCGNEYLLNVEGNVFFWNHKTNGLQRIAASLASFLEGLVAPPEDKLQSGQLKKVWANPAFWEEQKRLVNVKS